MTLLLVPILLPILGGLATGLIRFSSRRARSIFVECIALANSAVLFYLVFRGQGLSLSALRLTENHKRYIPGTDHQVSDSYPQQRLVYSPNLRKLRVLGKAPV